MLDRRCFLKFVGGAGVGILATPAVWKSLDDVSIWSQNWPWIPEPADGVPTYVRTISKLSHSNLGIRVRLLGDRPVNAYGDPEHPLSQGAINALAASEVQLLYSPARLRQPLKRGSDGALTPIAWDEALKLLTEGLKQARDKGGIYAISGDPTSVINEILQVLTESKTCLMPGEEQPAYAALKLMGGKGRLGYDIPHSDMVLAIGAGVLESWGTVVANRRAWAAGRPAGQEPNTRLAYAGPIQDNTATSADWWLPMRPGQELVVALGIAHLLIRAGKTADCADAPAFASLASAWTPAAVETATGVPAQRLEEVAKALLSAKHPLVVVGSPLNQGGSAAAIMAGVACNLLLGNLNAEGGLRILPLPGSALDVAPESLLTADLMACVQKLADGGSNPGAIIFYEANPVYALPGAAAQLLEKASFKIALTCFMDETAAACDLVLPIAMGLERYDDAETPYGCGEIIYSLAKPITSPMFEARPAGDLLLDVMKGLGMSAPQDTVAVLKARAKAIGANWTALSKGTPFVSKATEPQESLIFGANVLTQALSNLPGADDICLAPNVRLGVGTAETGIPPYAVKLVNAHEVTHKEHQSVAHLNGATASKIGVAAGDLVTITGPGGACTARISIDENVCTGAISMLVGMGHSAFDAFSQNKGSNLLQLAKASTEAGSGITMWNAIPVKVAKA